MRGASRSAKRDPSPRWSDSYRAILAIYHRDQHPGEPDDHAPFFLRASADDPGAQADVPRRLTENQYRGVQDHYARWRAQEYREQLYARARARNRRRRDDAKPAPAGRWDGPSWPAPLPGEEPYVQTPAQIALHRLHFATTKLGQARARKAVRALARQGSVAFRKALGDARRAIRQAKRTHSLQDMFFRIVPALELERFTWNFLRSELLAAIRLKRAREGQTRWTLQDLLKGPQDFEPELEALVKAYPFLGLTANDVVRGLKRDGKDTSPTEAEVVTARKFGISPAGLRSLLSRAL